LLSSCVREAEDMKTFRTKQKEKSSCRRTTARYGECHEGGRKDGKRNMVPILEECGVNESFHFSQERTRRFHFITEGTQKKKKKKKVTEAST